MIASTEIIKRNRVASKGLGYNEMVIFAAIVLVFLVCGSPAQAYGPLIEGGKTMFMVSGNSYYNGGEGEELAETFSPFYLLLRVIMKTITGKTIVGTTSW